MSFEMKNEFGEYQKVLSPLHKMGLILHLHHLSDVL
jgi:hypothetical protein